MKILIAEDDSTSRKFLFKFLSKYGECDSVADGLEALEAYVLSRKEKKPYDLICLDIMMPKIDGVKVLKTIMEIETRQGLLPEKRSKVIMTTALAQTQFVQSAFEIGCYAYVTKPIDIFKLEELLKKLGFVS